MKKIIAVTLSLALALSLYACGKKDGDLGKQTSIDNDNGYTVIQEVLTFKYSDEEDTFKGNENAKTSGFVTNQDNAESGVKTKTEALGVAKKEVADKYNKVKFAFDRTAGIWKVIFLLDTQNGEQTDSKTVMTVYVDEDGYTLATVK